MTRKITFLSLTLLLPLLLLTLIPFSPRTLASPPDPDTAELIKTALDRAVVEGREAVLSYVIYDVDPEKIDINRDGNWAVIWLRLLERETGIVVPTEPGLAFARLVNGEWQITLQSDGNWIRMLNETPNEILSAADKKHWREFEVLACDTSAYGPYGGFLLPWAEGESRVLTRSILHHDPPDTAGSMHYAFDFAAPWVGGSSPMFGIYASKSGTVKWVRDVQPNGDESSPGNYIVLEDTTTAPATYQLYLHLAKDTIPPNFQVIGTPVLQGQYLGLADDTGFSSGNHLHFQTHTNPASYWGCSVDVLFDDVTINGGRPRTQEEAEDYPQYGDEWQYSYVSSNTIRDDITAPIGDLFSPMLGDVMGETVTIEGWALDEGSGVDQLQVYANWGTGWKDIGPPIFDTLFEFEWNMCTQGSVPDGPVTFGMLIVDNAGNVSERVGFRTAMKSFDCAPHSPACQPNANQAAIFSERDYGGECLTLDVGSHPLLMGEDGLIQVADPERVGGAPLNLPTVASVIVGDNVMLTLFHDLLSGRGQTFIAENSSLDDDWAGISEKALAVVQLDTNLPALAPAPIWPTNGSTFTDTASVSLVWDDGGGSKEFQARLRNNFGTVDFPWQAEPFFNLGSLVNEDFEFRVRARNDAGATGWSPWVNFTVEDDPSALPLPLDLPYNENFEGGLGDWEVSGLWHLLNDGGVAHGGTKSVWYGSPGNNFSNGTYDTGAPNTGDLTSPPVDIVGTGNMLRFWYRYETEGSGENFDQRWVQISVNGDPFFNVLQLTDDPPNTWLESPPIDLSAYDGLNIQVRFHFETMDERNNDFTGWVIDDVHIDGETALVCNDSNEGNDDPGSATLLNPGVSILGDVCPEGDADYFAFTGSAGVEIGLDVDANEFGSLLDPALSLLDEDGESVLAENDDQVPNFPDSFLVYEIPRNGTYYVRMQAWDHPSVGGPGYNYTLTLRTDPSGPTITSLDPVGSLTDNFYIHDNVAINVGVNPGGTDIQYAEFYYHSGDWSSVNWQVIGYDIDGSDGWGYVWDTTSIPEQLGMGLYVRVVDQAGNAAVAGVWNLAIDRTPPETIVTPLPPTQGTTAIYLEWVSEDDTAPIRQYDIRKNIDNTGWVAWMIGIDPLTTSVWTTGTLGTLYGFRVRAIDDAGNLEPYNYPGDQNEATTLILACTAPDEYEGDNTFAAASPINATQTHNFCVPGDEDWVKFEAEGGEAYSIRVTPLDPTSTAILQIYASDGTTLLAEVNPLDNLYDPDSDFEALGQPVNILWEATQTETLYIRLRHLIPSVAGNAVRYTIAVEGEFLYLPVMNR